MRDDLPLWALARRTDVETSHEAARSVGELRPKQRAVLRVIRLAGRALTDCEIADAYARAMIEPSVPDQSESGLRTRRSELVKAGLVKDSGSRTRLASGRRAVCWVVA